MANPFPPTPADDPASNDHLVGPLTCRLDSQGRILQASPSWQLQFGLSEEQLIGTPLLHDFWKAPAGPCCLQGVDLCDTLGVVHHMQWLLVPDEQEEGVWQATGWDVTALAEALAQAQQQALIDPLTGLKNRRAFTERLNEELARHQRHQIPLSMLMLDVDLFKKYNDTYGHQAGDQVLQQLGSCLLAQIRSIDFVARIGGEEFVVLLPNTTVITSTQLAERLRQAVEQQPWPNCPITISVGAATLPPAHPPAPSGELSHLLYQIADQALYHAKNSGRNRLVHAGNTVLSDL